MERPDWRQPCFRRCCDEIAAVRPSCCFADCLTVGALVLTHFLLLLVYVPVSPSRRPVTVVDLPSSLTLSCLDSKSVCDDDHRRSQHRSNQGVRWVVRAVYRSAVLMFCSLNVRVLSFAMCPHHVSAHYVAVGVKMSARSSSSRLLPAAPVVPAVLVAALNAAQPDAYARLQQSSL